MGIPLWKPRDDENVRKDQRHTHTMSGIHHHSVNGNGASRARRTIASEGGAILRDQRVGRVQPHNNSTSSNYRRRSRAIAAMLRMNGHRPNSNLPSSSRRMSLRPRPSATSAAGAPPDATATLDDISPLGIIRRSLDNSLGSQTNDADNLDRMVHQRLTEKEDLLNQLEFTVSLLDQFLTARSALGSDFMAIPSFITEELPSVLATAASMASLNGSSQRSQDRVDQVLQSQPYANRMQRLDSGIATAHQRIQDQLCELNRSSLDIDSSTHGYASSGARANANRRNANPALGSPGSTATGDTGVSVAANAAIRPRGPDRRRRYSASPRRRCQGQFRCRCRCRGRPAHVVRCSNPLHLLRLPRLCSSIAFTTTFLILKNMAHMSPTTITIWKTVIVLQNPGLGSSFFLYTHPAPCASSFLLLLLLLLPFFFPYIP
ncbi:hypothetical protein BCR43DRAFT_559344 [Syncephalastrum racemosum]|uniref:Uncharacterized protein n=1 Tax=Syncephalastrum racemosum TaxID=13706 RepID=A0A1X2HS50_SYNRA|nr:hypothetical protein BCR43DRAFT_559344 [Syncephalastrum racemosum]